MTPRTGPGSTNANQRSTESARRSSGRPPSSTRARVRAARSKVHCRDATVRRAHPAAREAMLELQPSLLALGHYRFRPSIAQSRATLTVRNCHVPPKRRRVPTTHYPPRHNVGAQQTTYPLSGAVRQLSFLGLPRPVRASARASPRASLWHGHASSSSHHLVLVSIRAARIGVGEAVPRFHAPDLFGRNPSRTPIRSVQTDSL